MHHQASPLNLDFWVPVFLILCGTKYAQSTSAVYKRWWLSHCAFVERWTLPFFSKWNTVFAWKKLWLFRLECSADVFSKKNEVSLSLQGKQLTVFVANDKNWAFKLKSEFWKHVSTTINLTASQYLKTGLAT